MGALSNRSFLGLFLGRIVSNLGDSLYVIAAMWLVYELSGSSFYTGLAGFFLQLPRTLQFLAGPVVDRIPLKKVLLGTQVVQGLLVLLVPVTYALDRLTPALVVALIFFLACLNQFMYPAQNSALPKVVREENIVRANSLLSFGYKAVDLIGRAVAGVLIGLVGAVSLYVVDAFTFLLAALLFTLITIPDSDRTGGGELFDYREYVEDLKQGFSFIRHSVLAYVVASAILANFASGISFAVLPVFSDVRGGSGLYGLLMGATAGGILVGSLLATYLESYPFGRVQAAIFFPGTVLWVAAIQTEWAPGTVVLFALAWIPVGIYNVMIQTVRQVGVPEDLIGRVTSASVSIATIAAPLGSLVGGAASELVGAELTMLLVSLGYLSVSVVYVFHPSLRTLPSVVTLSPEDIRTT